MASRGGKQRGGKRNKTFHNTRRFKHPKSFGKSKDFDSGRIGRLDDDTLGYYRRVSEGISKGFIDKTEQEQFVSNVFAQVDKDELKVSQNQTVSHVLENLLRIASGKQVCGFLQGLQATGDICNAAKDRFAGHVLQTAVLQAVTKVEDPDCGSEVEKVLLAVCKEVSSKLSEFINHTYAVHVLSAVIEVLAGVRVPERVTRSKLSQRQMHAKDCGNTATAILKETPTSFLDQLKKITQDVLNTDNFVDLLLSPLASPVVAVLLLVLKTADPDMCETLCNTVIKEYKLQTKSLDKSVPPAMLTHPIASHVIEVLIHVASDKQFNKLCSVCFKGRYKSLAIYPTASFVLQKVIRRAVHTDTFEDLFAELSDCLEDIMAVKYYGVIIFLAEACVLRPAQQGAFMLSLLNAFHCLEPKERRSASVLLIASLTKYEQFFDEETKAEDDEEKEDGSASEKKNTSRKQLTVTVYGSRILQQLLKFQNCGSISAGFLALTPGDVVAMACNPAGSFLLEAFMASGVNEKKKNKVIYNLKDRWVKVACNKHGSRTLESIFSAASMVIKYSIVEELAAKEDTIAGNRYGRFVHKNCAVNRFKYRPEEWKGLQSQEAKKRKLFADIIGEDEKTKQTKKKKPNTTDQEYFKEMAVLGVHDTAEDQDIVKEEENHDDQESDSEMQDIFGKIRKQPQQRKMQGTIWSHINSEKVIGKPQKKGKKFTGKRHKKSENITGKPPQKSEMVAEKPHKKIKKVTETSHKKSKKITGKPLKQRSDMHKKHNHTDVVRTEGVIKPENVEIVPSKKKKRKGDK